MQKCKQTTQHICKEQTHCKNKHGTTYTQHTQTQLNNNDYNNEINTTNSKAAHPTQIQTISINDTQYIFMYLYKQNKNHKNKGDTTQRFH